MSVTDVHNHAIPQVVLDLITSDPAYEVAIVDGVWSSRNQGPFPMLDAWTSPEAKLAELDSKGLDRAILSVAPKPLFFYDLPLDKQLVVTEVSNHGLAEFCSGHEDRLGWMAHVPLAFPEQAAEVVRAAVAMGARGVELGTSAMGRRLDDPVYEVLWDAIGPLDLPILLHPAYESTGPEAQGYGLAGVLGLPYEITNSLQRLICGHVLDRHPRLRIIATLGGGFFPYIIGRLHHYSTYVPELADAPRDPWSYVGQIKFDTHLHDPVALRYLIERAGIDNVLVGTDCSFLSQTGDPIRELSDAVDGDADAVRKIAESNAEPFWNAGGAAEPAGAAAATAEAE
jgi:aminocarboxymuconate-semialdehyde decarboxylase